MRKFYKACAIASAMSGLVASSAGAATIGYWRFEEGSNGQIASGAGTVIDSSGNGFNGTAFGSPKYVSDVPQNPIYQTAAPNHESMQFSGTNVQRVRIDDNPLFKVGSFTIEAYVKVAGTPHAGESIFQRGDDRAQNDPIGLLVNDSSTIKLLCYSGSTPVEVLCNYPGFNQWFHVAATFNDQTGLMAIYINGVMQNSLTTNLRFPQDLDPNYQPGVAIGGLPSATYGDFITFDGDIDEVRFSNTVLAPSQFLGVPEPTTAMTIAPLGIAATLRPRRNRR